MFHCLLLLENTDIVDLHRAGQGALVDTLHAAPVATPGQIEDGVEGVVERPLVVAAAQLCLGHGQLYLSVHIGGDGGGGPLKGVGVELALGTGQHESVGLLRVLGVVVVLSVDRR